MPELPKSFDSFALLHLNIRGFRSHADELCARLALCQCPHFVALTETLLDDSTPVVKLPGYTLVSRRDRRDRSGGGIALFARLDVDASVVHISDSEAAERSWHTIHSDAGPILLGVWYRPPDYNDTGSISSLRSELLDWAPESFGMILVGDINVHHKAWLIHSRCTSPAGRSLFDICAENSLQEHTSVPTRCSYLLDLTLSNMGNCLSCCTLPGLSDHRMVLCRCDFPISSAPPVERWCFKYGAANWTGLRTELHDLDWDATFRNKDAGTCAAIFTKKVLTAAAKHIPYQLMSIQRPGHPWIDNGCLEAISTKIAAEGSPDYQRLRDECTSTLRRAFNRFIVKIKKKLATYTGSMKKWWKLSQSLTLRKDSSSSVPPLRRDRYAEWTMDPAVKAELFGEVFARKSQLPRPAPAKPPWLERVLASASGWVPIRAHAAKAALKALKEDSSTGPDGLPARVLNQCHRELARPVAMLSRIILNDGVWPSCWKHHWIHPLYKRHAKWNPGNYRGLHLTPQLSKVVERILGKFFQAGLEKSGAYGPRQFAYSHERGHKDALAFMVFSWILAFNGGKRVGMYCSDVSGAFDKVAANLLVQKLAGTNIPRTLLRVISSWLDKRTCTVVVNGAHSATLPLSDSVYQGTVWGPPLWNGFFADARHAINAQGFTESVFADDCTAFRCYDALVQNNTILDDLHCCQDALHAWGTSNLVSFDSSKESLHILHPRRPYGPSFRILGVLFDCQLTMDGFCSEVAARAYNQLNVLLRTRQFHSEAEIVRLYKSYILSFIEAGTPAYYHAPVFFTGVIDRVQTRLLDELGISSETALEKYKLAPLCTRRDIAMLGLLFRIVRGFAPEPLSALFPRMRCEVSLRSSRGRHLRHDMQLHDRIDGAQSQMFERSIFGLVYTFNLLPKDILLVQSPRDFQGLLLTGVRKAAAERLPSWCSLLRSGPRCMDVHSFQRLFV